MIINTAQQKNEAAVQNRSIGYSFRVYFWILSYIRPYKWSFLLLVTCGLIMTISEMSVPRYIQYLIDRILPSKELQLFYKASFALVAVLLVMYIAMALENLLKRSIQEKASRDMQYSVFHYLRKLGFSYYEQHPVGETLSLLNTDVTAVRSVYTDYLPAMIQQTLTIVVPFAFLLSINVQLTVLVLPCYFLYYLGGPYIDKKSSVYLEKQTKDRHLMNRKIYESISAIAEVRAFHAEQWDFQRMMDRYITYKNTRLTSLWYRHWRSTFRSISIGIGVILLYVLGSDLVRRGALTVGEFISFTIYSTLVMRNFGRITITMMEQTYILEQAKRLYELLRIKPDIEEIAEARDLTEIQGRLSFRNVYFSYPTRPDMTVLRGFNLDIRPGEKIAVVGTSGNGKSSLLKLICRFYDPTAGDIELDGVPLPHLSLRSIRESIGFVFQETYLFGTTIRENIRFGKPEASDVEVIEAAKSAYAHDFIMQMPDGYDTHVGERGARLSGGQKQRISIARLFIKNPKIVLLDEATAALDNVSEVTVQKALDALLEGRTTVTVAHRLSTIQHYDRIAVLQDGQVAEIGNYTELMEKKRLFFTLAEGELRDE